MSSISFKDFHLKTQKGVCLDLSVTCNYFDVPPEKYGVPHVVASVDSIDEGGNTVYEGVTQAVELEALLDTVVSESEWSEEVDREVYLLSVKKQFECALTKVSMELIDIKLMKIFE